MLYWHHESSAKQGLPGLPSVFQLEKEMARLLG